MMHHADINRTEAFPNRSDFLPMDVSSGCLNHLEELEQKLVFGGKTFRKEPQRQPMLTFKVTSPRAKTGVATVNLRCLPFSGTDGKTDISQDTCGSDSAAKVFYIQSHQKY